MKDTISESVEIAVTVSVTFENLDLIIASLSEAIGNRARKRIEDTGSPVDHGLSAFSESINAAVISRVNPIGQSSFGRFSVITIQDFQKIFFVKMSCTKSRRDV